MKAINTYGLKVDLESLVEAAKQTCSYKFRGARDDVYYDKSNGEVWTKFHASENEWSVYHDSDVILCGATRRHVSAQTMMDMIHDAIEEEKALAKYL